MAGRAAPVALIAVPAAVAYQLAVNRVQAAATASDLVVLSSAVVTAAAAARTSAGTRGPMRRVWTWGTVAFGAWALGLASWTIARQLTGRPPGGASPAYLLFALFTATNPIMLLRWPSAASPGARLRTLLDGLAALAAVVFLAWRPLLMPLLATPGADRRTVITTLATSAADLVTLALCLLRLANTRAAGRRALLPLTGGTALLMGSGLLIGYWQALGSPRTANGADAALLAGTLLLLVSARRSRREPAEPPPTLMGPGRREALLLAPLLPAAAAAVTAAVQHMLTRRLDNGQLGAALTCIAAVLTRQYLAVRDATRLADQIQAQLWLDPLTGLGNRLLVDLDGFKQVNDTYGHDAGDQLLRTVADRLRGCLRATDTVVRLGGDEFVVLLESVPFDQHVHDLASRLLTALRTPAPLAEAVVTISGSVGVALDRGGLSAEELLAAADLAMYVAKRAGRDRLHWHEPQPPGRRARRRAHPDPTRCRPRWMSQRLRPDRVTSDPDSAGANRP